MKTVFGHLAIKAKKKLLIVRVKANENTMIIFFHIWYISVKNIHYLIPGGLKQK